MNVVRAGALANSTSSGADESGDSKSKALRKRITGHYIEGFNLHPIANKVSHIIYTL